MPSAMIFDDHEVGDDWNISEAWLEETRQHPTWNDQTVGGYASYWIYQNLGNLSPEELHKDDLHNEVKGLDDAWPVLREFAHRTHRVADGTRWSYHRDLGNTRLLMIDSPGGRVLQEGRLYQVVCSPLRNALPNEKSFVQAHAWTKPATLATRLLAQLADVPVEPITWLLTHEAAFFDNQVATLELEGRNATIIFEKAVLDASKEPTLEKPCKRRRA